MSYQIKLPDGSLAWIADDVPNSKALELAKKAYPDAFPETPGIGSQLLSAPKEFIKSAASGVVQSIGGLGALPYAGARYISPELPPFEKTGFGKAITGAEQYLAPSDEGVITQVVGGLGSVASLLGPQVALRGLGAAGRFAGVAPRAAMPVGVAQTAGLGAEEARQRVEIARGDKIDVTPGQELEALAIGVPIGLTELLPVEKLFRGLDKTLSGDVKLTIYNYIGRGLAQGGIEGAQEAASGLMQDLSAKGIYDSNIDVGSSMLHDAMLGGGVGFLAQTGLDFLLRKDIGRAYQAKLANDKQRELNKKIDAYQQEIDKQTIQKNKNLNVSDPNLLSLPPPSPEVEHQGKPDPLMNPLGFFKEGELSPEYLKAVNDIRKKEGKQSISQFSIEDLADAGAPQQEVDRLLAAKTGYTGETQLSSDDVLNVASKKNIDTSTVGFLDFLRRTTGAENLNEMSQPQLFSAFKALDALAPSDKLQVLPPGTNSTRFSTEQYDKAIEKLTSVFPEDNMMSRHEIIKNIKKVAGLKNNRDAESILQTAILKDDLTTVNREVYETGKKGDMTSPAINVYTNREEAEREAARRDLDIRERTHQYIALPGKATQLPGGPDIRKGTFEKGVEPAEYEIRFPDGIKLTAPSIEEANAKADRVQAIRTEKSGDLLKQISEKQQSMKKDQFDLENMESEGKSDTLEYKKKSAEVSVKTKKLQDEIDNLKAQVQFLTDSPNISPKGQKPITENGFTLFEQNKPISTFQTQEAAEEFAIMRLPDNILQDIVNLAPEQKGLMPKRLGVLANKEIARRSGKGPSGLGIEYTGKKEDVEKRLAEIGIFTPQFQKQVNELDKKLRPIMNRLGLGDLRLNIVRAIKTREGQEANGSYVRGLIEIALDADNPMRALRHEGIHALKELGAFTKDQWRVLENKAKSEWMSKYDIQNRYSGLSMDEMIEEAIAEAFADFSTTKAPPGLIGALFNKIKTFFDAMGNALRGMGFQTAEDIFQATEEGRLRTIPKEEIKPVEPSIEQPVEQPVEIPEAQSLEVTPEVPSAEKPVTEAPETEVAPFQEVLTAKPKFSLKQTNTPRYPIREQLGQDTVDAIDRTTKKREVKGFSDRISEAMSPTSFAKFRQGYINKYESIEKLSHAVSKVFGSKELMADTSAIAAALLSDRAAGVAASSYKNGIPVYRKGFTTVSNENGEVKGLIPILEPLMELNDPFAFQAFQFYAATRRGRRLDQEQRENLFTEDDLRRGRTLGKMFPVFKTVFAEYQKYNKGLVDFMRDTGVISEKEAEIWTENWDYIPFYRQMDGEKTLGPNIFSSIAGVSKPKKLKGGEAPLDDFMETIIRNSRAAIESGMKNVAAQKVMRDVLRMNQGELVRPSQAVGDDIVTVKENGVTKHYRVDDPLLVESLKGLNLPQLPFLEILAKPAEVLRNLVTKDPGFMMANLMRDSIQSWVTSGTDMKPLVDTFKQYASTLANRSPEAQALANAGLFAGYDFGSDTKSSARAVEAALRKRTGKLTTKEKAILPLTKIWDMLDQGSAASDVATRAEIYKRTLAETGNEAEALYQAMEVLNFSRKGNSALIRVLSAMVPFMNARIQGLDVLYRSGFGKMATQNKERMQKAFISRSMTLFALSWMYWMLASDTDEYKTAEQETRDNNWIIGNVRIPIPFEIGTVFKVMPERILEYFLGSDTSKDLKESIVRNITSTLALNPIPQAFLPVVENMANYSFFTGKPIVGRGMEDVAKPYQVAPSTSLLAKKVSEITEPFLYDKLQQSPIQIDHLIRGYTGTLGTYAVMALDSIFRGEGSPTKATLKAEQMPVVKRFFASEEGTGTVSAYYELKKNVDESVRTINFLERTGNIDDLREYMKEKGIKLQAIKPYIQTLDKEMTRLHDMKRMIQSSNMNPDDKRDVLSKIHTAEVKLTSGIQRIKNFID